MLEYEYDNDRRHGYYTAKRTVDPDCAHSPTPKKSIENSLKNAFQVSFLCYLSKKHMCCFCHQLGPDAEVCSFRGDR